MVTYLSRDEIIEINKQALEIQGEGKQHILEYPFELLDVLKRISNDFTNIYDKALAHCISLIVIHAFKNGNHRTSLISSEHFLLKNKCKSQATDDKRLALQQWRLEHEEKYGLEREFWYVFCIEDDDKRWEKIKEIMYTKYGSEIYIWLKENYTQC